MTAAAINTCKNEHCALHMNKLLSEIQSTTSQVRSVCGEMSSNCDKIIKILESMINICPYTGKLHQTAAELEDLGNVINIPKTDKNKGKVHWVQD